MSLNQSKYNYFNENYFSISAHHFSNHSLIKISAAPNVLKGSSSGTVYLHFDGKKYGFTHSLPFLRISNWDEVTTVPNSVIAGIPSGPPIDFNVQLIKGKDTATVYLAQFGKKRPIANMSTFNALGFDTDKISVVEHHILQLFVNGPTISI